ncbi:excinuclease ABC subunit UvrC [Candidatus Gracilibacteria bacterium]|nr:excinuclease ABC subunit UvrC [Candidatus Gracilibacteria bacterium]
MFVTPPQIKTLLKNCSRSAGVYKMIDENQTVIYVGKAKNLKNRVSSYFRTTKDISPKVAVMREKVVTIEFTITRTELEALILETNLIKSLRPKYNILMKDDKNYVYVRIDRRADFPELEIVRRFQKDSNAYYYGPYTSAESIFKTLKGLQRLFPYRSCHGDIIEVTPGQTTTHNLSRKAPCLDYYIKRCLAPCIGKVSKEEYQSNIQNICSILDGNYQELRKYWQESMREAVEKKAFEQAAKCRDRLQALTVLVEKQYATLTSGNNQDVIAVASDNRDAVIAIFMIRAGQIIRTDHFNLSDHTATSDHAALLESFIQQYYTDAASIPDEIVTGSQVNQTALLEEFLTTIKGKKVQLILPERGDRKQLINMVQDNANLQLINNKQAWEREQANTTGATKVLQEALSMKQPVRRIECYDISHIQGTNKIGSMIVFIDGKPETSHYRRFKIKELEEGINNDFASLQEVLTRRIQYLDSVYREKKKRRREKIDILSLPETPDLIIIDGGKGQLSSVVKALKAEVKGGLKVKLPKIVSLAKREEEIFVPNQSEAIMLERDSPALFLIQRIRDEAHRFAITGHRNLRSKKMVQSKLDVIDGIGPKTKKKLLAHFGSVKGIKAASYEDLLTVVNETVADQLRDQL